MSRLMSSFFLFVLVLLTASCAQQPFAGESEDLRYGTIIQIDHIMIPGNEHIGLGAVIGGVAGGLIGNQFGAGDGQTLATVAGVLAGGYGGSKVQTHMQKQEGQHIFVRLNNGITVGITQPTNATLHVGQKVRITGKGSDARVVLQ